MGVDHNAVTLWQDNNVKDWKSDVQHQLADVQKQYSQAFMELLKDPVKAKEFLSKVPKDKLMDLVSDTARYSQDANDPLFSNLIKAQDALAKLEAFDDKNMLKDIIKEFSVSLGIGKHAQEIQNARLELAKAEKAIIDKPDLLYGFIIRNFGGVKDYGKEQASARQMPAHIKQTTSGEIIITNGQGKETVLQDALAIHESIVAPNNNLPNQAKTNQLSLS